ncbi:minor capsid protein [Streptomyces sp. NPDC048442]|uniref:phage tail terminator protein n=1 Tax=Streptomyces sp. NPDC048442 TaxID=3154823 RepID=UPI003434E949
MGYTADLLDGIAGLISGAGLAVYRPTGIYTPAETGIVFSVMPDTPDRIVCLSTYPVEDPDLSDAITGIQIRLRASRDPRDVNDLADDLLDLLHNRQAEQMGSAWVALLWRQSQALMGQDEHGRMELAANYYARTTRSAPNLYE